LAHRFFGLLLEVVLPAPGSFFLLLRQRLFEVSLISGGALVLP